MIKAYVTGISTHYEGEDIEIRYSIYDEEELLCKKSVFKEYKKPLVVGQVALVTLLKELKSYSDKEITIIINDPALNEQVRGTSTTQNRDVLKMARRVKEELSKFGDSLIIRNVSEDRAELMKWNKILQP
ncbi:hypothetical protein Amet_3733 [Alkaliphilus metalliredigens QYMF]|uniref:Uncharacterized protein n=1 Tax=Alkaliphilus metalliredigens (strain QYMF) TaxID=293826 RepID=A6TUI4_ALKMQ|nr:hypothetical protein [Alkaliphilus metalliredigens]ABR49852.1 hypothetical protein Amet_3733 [Alkaliphilus metalliredigens QYMF]